MADGATLADVGEFALIARIADIIGNHRARTGDIGIGDDAAVIGLGVDPRVVATTDMLIEGRHFRLDWSSAYDIGRKAAAQNLADLEAMGARPVSLLIAFGAPGTTPVSFTEDLTRGLVDEAAAAGAVISGGDTVRAASVVLSVTAFGSLDGRVPVLRSGAGPGGILYVAGLLGWSAAGLALLERGDTELLERHRALVDVHRVPCPPYGYGAAAATAGATAMIDLSDGLLADLAHLLEASGVGAELLAESWQDPAVIAAGRDLGIDPSAWFTAGGEDHALLFTLPAGCDVPAHPLLRRIGIITGSPGLWIDQVAVAAVGFDHFLATS